MGESTTLSKRQKQIYEYICSYCAEKKYPPSNREIGEAVGLSSTASVSSQLHALIRKGYITMDKTKSRSITILSRDEAVPENFDADLDCGESLPYSAVELPVVGSVAAGCPILAEQNIEETLILPKSIVGDSSSFLLKVRGESMIEAGILNGDYVVVKEQQTASNGDIVVAILDDSATVKSFYKENGRIRLQPHNSSMDPIYCDEVQIAGKVVALFRTL